MFRRAIQWATLVAGILMSGLLSASDFLDECPGSEVATRDALAASGQAFAEARQQRDDAAGAAAARQIAALGICSGDPLKAQNWLIVAERLEPDHPYLVDLRTALDAARDDLTEAEINAGLSETRGLGVVNNLLGGDVASSSFWEAEAEAASGSSTELDSGTSAPPARSINIPIRFDSNSTVLTDETARNVRNLATVLAAMPPGTTFSLIGHADVRGDAAYNFKLSLARAQSIRTLLIEQAPSLDGRVAAEGDGENRPVDQGDSDRAHANNRRLEVRVMQGPAVED